jgi:hypothetical protein
MTTRYQQARNFAIVSIVALVAVGTASMAIAQEAPAAGSNEHALGQHPAILVQRMQPGIDTNRFIVAHPAGLQVIATPTPTYDHPAVIVARMAREASLLDTYMAQPPIASQWLRHGDTAVASRRAQQGS